MVSTHRKSVAWPGGESFCVGDRRETKHWSAAFMEADAKGDIEAMDELLAPDFVDHSLLPGQDPDREDYMRAVAEYHAIFSNPRFIIEDQVAEGDKVVTPLSREHASTIEGSLWA